MNSGGYRAGNHVVSGGGGGGGGGYGGPSGARPSSYSRRPITQLRPSSLNSRDTDVSAAASAMQPSECEGGEYSRQSSVLGRVSGGRSRSTGKTNGSKGTAVSISRPRMAVFTKYESSPRCVGNCFHLSCLFATILRQIARQREQQERGASVDTGHGDRQSSASAVFRPFASARPSTSERSSAVHNPEHKSSGAVGEPVTAVGAANHHGRRQAGFMGYLYGGSGGEGGDATKDPERGSELVGRPSRASQWHPSSLVDLRLQLVPDGVRVLNAEEESQAAYGGGARRASAANSKKPITGAE